MPGLILCISAARRRQFTFVVQQSLEMQKVGTAAEKARMADGGGAAAVDDAETEAPPGDDEKM